MKGVKRIGETGFEPATPWSRTKCSTRLSHSPIGAGYRRGAGKRKGPWLLRQPGEAPGSATLTRNAGHAPSGVPVAVSRIAESGACEPLAIRAHGVVNLGRVIHAETLQNLAFGSHVIEISLPQVTRKRSGFFYWWNLSAYRYALGGWKRAQGHWFGTAYSAPQCLQMKTRATGASARNSPGTSITVRSASVSWGCHPPERAGQADLAGGVP